MSLAIREGHCRAALFRPPILLTLKLEATSKMELVRWLWILFVPTLCSFSILLHVDANSNLSIASLDSAVRDCALDTLIGAQTGEIYQLQLPSNLSGIGASAVRLRSGSLWNNGADVGTFRIRPRTTTAGYARRILLVYQDLGNWSSLLYRVPGHSLVAPVVGLLAYDGSDRSPSDGIRQLQLGALGEAISITFPEIRLPEGLNATAIKCVIFGLHGLARLYDPMINSAACSTKNAGHFAIAVPSIVPGPSRGAVPATDSAWRVPLVACAGGVTGLALVGLVWIGIIKLLRLKKMQEMESQSDDNEALGTIGFGRSKMPYAAMIRTQPVLEDGNAP